MKKIYAIIILSGTLSLWGQVSIPANISIPFYIWDVFPMEGKGMQEYLSEVIYLLGDENPYKNSEHKLEESYGGYLYWLGTMNFKDGLYERARLAFDLEGICAVKEINMSFNKYFNRSYLPYTFLAAGHAAFMNAQSKYGAELENMTIDPQRLAIASIYYNTAIGFGAWEGRFGIAVLYALMMDERWGKRRVRELLARCRSAEERAVLVFCSILLSDKLSFCFLLGQLSEEEVSRIPYLAENIAVGFDVFEWEGSDMWTEELEAQKKRLRGVLERIYGRDRVRDNNYSAFELPFVISKLNRRIALKETKRSYSLRLDLELIGWGPREDIGKGKGLYRRERYLDPSRKPQPIR